MEVCTVDRRTLEKALRFFESLEAADAIYKSCQSTTFRQFAQQCLRAPATEEAFRKIREALDKKDAVPDAVN